MTLIESVKAMGNDFIRRASDPTRLYANETKGYSGHHLLCRYNRDGSLTAMGFWVEDITAEDWEVIEAREALK